MRKPRIPEWTRVWRVDEVIECLPLGPDSATIERELMAVMPDAYENKRPPDYPDWKPGDDRPRNELPPEPDVAEIYGQSLSCIWRKLKPETRKAIQDAYNKEFGDDTD